MIAALATTTIASSCGQDVSLGPGNPPGASSASSGGSGAGGGGVTDCDQLPCGTRCALEPHEPPQYDGYCDGLGSCRAEYPCETYDPCVGKVCGDACDPCAPSDGNDCPEPFEPFVCDPYSTCVPAPVSCRPCELGDEHCLYDSCKELGLPCGSPCTLCHPEDPSCQPRDGLVCNGLFTCLPTDVVSCDPCLDKNTLEPASCGQPCSFCDAKPWEPCDETDPFLYVCDFDGYCNPPEVMSYCPPDLQPCADKQCGDPCTICDPELTSCAEVGYQLFCNEDLLCSQFFSCDPCSDDNGEAKACGTPCSPCHPNDPGCAADSTIPYFCDAFGQCNLPEAVACPSTYVPCGGKACGELCTVCDKNSNPSCPAQDVFLACTDESLCWELPPPCGWVPCLNLSCGEPCSPCDPSDPSCTEPPLSKTCDAAGNCVDAPGACP
jgi:hypothetical protein